MAPAIPARPLRRLSDPGPHRSHTDPITLQEVLPLADQELGQWPPSSVLIGSPTHAQLQLRPSTSETLRRTTSNASPATKITKRKKTPSSGLNIIRQPPSHRYPTRATSSVKKGKMKAVELCNDGEGQNTGSKAAGEFQTFNYSKVEQPNDGSPAGLRTQVAEKRVGPQTAQASFLGTEMNEVENDRNDNHTRQEGRHPLWFLRAAAEVENGSREGNSHGSGQTQSEDSSSITRQSESREQDRKLRGNSPLPPLPAWVPKELRELDELAEKYPWF
jgi:hypothetical protein